MSAHSVSIQHSPRTHETRGAHIQQRDQKVWHMLENVHSNFTRWIFSPAVARSGPVIFVIEALVVQRRPGANVPNKLQVVTSYNAKKLVEIRGSYDGNDVGGVCCTP